MEKTGGESPSFYLLTAEEMRDADARTSSVIGIPSLVLMERAALAMADEIGERVKPGARIVTVSGKGNNGADGLALARILDERGYEVTALVLSLEGRPGSSFETQIRILENLGRPAKLWEKGAVPGAKPDVVVDAVFGTGLARDVEGTAGEAVEEINEAGREGAFILACDMPSGISSDTGKVLGSAVQADLTVTFGFFKRGQFLYPGCTYCRETVRADIGITEKAFSKTPQMTAFKKSAFRQLLPERSPSGNKGTFGKVLLVAGSENMAGACLLAARSAGRAGAGMVKVFTEECNRVIVQSTVPECLLGTYENGNREKAFMDLERSMEWADVIAAGPGLGKTQTKINLVYDILSHAADGTYPKKRYVLDADAVRIIAENDLYAILEDAGKVSDILLTPHLAEAAALLGIPIAELREDIPAAAKSFADRMHVTILIKDARSVLATWKSDEICLNISGNSGLSTAGSGDVLTGICAALLAQGLPAERAGAVGAFLHGLAAERLTGDGDTRTLTAADLPDAVGALIRGM